MAITGTDRGTGSHNTAATSFTLSPSGNYASGSWAVLVVASDNSGASGGAMAAFGVTDSLGNTWTRRVSPLYDPGSADAGVEGAIFTTSQNGGSLTTSTVITVSFGASTPTAKAWTLSEIVPSGGSTLAYEAGNVSAGSNTSTPTITTSSITSAHIVIAGLFSETGEAITGDGDTTNGSWSTQQTATTSAGSGASHISVASQRKIVSATATQTYNPTVAIATDNVLGWIQLSESSSPQTVSPAGLASGASLGSPIAAVVVVATGKASTVSFGTAFAFSGTLTPSGIASAASLGTAVLAVVVTLSPSGIASTASFGTASAATSNVAQPSGIASAVSFGTPSVVGALLSTYSPNHRGTLAEYRRMAYITNGWDKVQRWDGRTFSVQLAGIEGPSQDLDSWKPNPVDTAGACDDGVHLVRYRYMDSSTGFVSNPSEEREATSASGKLTFLIGPAIAQQTALTNIAITSGTTITRGSGDWTATPYFLAVGDYVTLASAENAANDGTWGPITSLSATAITIASGGLTNNADDDTVTVGRSAVGRIQVSSDAKVDRIVLEASVVGGSEFFEVAEVLDTDGTVAMDMSDAELEEQFLPWDDDGHDVPPVAKYVVSHRDRLWLFGQVTHSTGTADFTNSSTHVDDGTTDPDWRASALGDSTAATPVYPSVTWFMQKDGDSEIYEIDTYDESDDQIDLKTAYAGSTSSNSTYQIFTRANVVWVSRPGYPEAFQPLLFLNGPNNEMAGDLTAGVGYGSSMIFYSLSSMTKLAWDADPLEDPAYIPLSTKYGALNQRVVIEVEGRIYAMDRLGWTKWQGTFPETISRPIDSLRALIDYSKAENFHCSFFPALRAVRWFVCYAGETYPKHYVQYDVDTGQWGTGELLQGISESKLVPTSDGPKVLYGDENGHTWFADVGTCDGCDEDDSHLTTTTGSTATVIAIGTPTLPTSGVGLAGCYAMWRKTDGTYVSRLIESNTASTITIASTFGSTLGTGEEIWVGPILAKLKTRAYSSKKSKAKKIRPKYLNVEFTPETSTRQIQIRAYDDLSDTAKTWRTAAPNDGSGITFPGNDTTYPTSDWLADVANSDGTVSIPAGAEFRRYVEFELEMNEPDATYELVSLEVETNEKEARDP